LADMTLPLQAACLVLSGISIVMAVMAMRSYGKVLGSALFYLVLAIVFFATMHAIEMLGMLMLVTTVSSFTAEIWSHLMLYTGMGLFIISMRKVYGYHRTVSQPGFFSAWDQSGLVLLAIWWLALILLMIPLDPYVSPYGDSLIHTTGLVHFIAFALGAYAAVMVWRLRKGFGKTITSSVPSLIAAICFLALEQLWELLADSWKVIRLPEITFESVEMVLFSMAIVAFIVAFRKMYKAVPH